MNETPPIVPCGQCGQEAYVGRGGIRCYCTPRLSAAEHHYLMRALAEGEANRD